MATTPQERRVLDYLATVNHGAWQTARMIADHSGVFVGLTNRSKAGAMTALLKKLHAHGHVEKEATQTPTIWRQAQ